MHDPTGLIAERAVADAAPVDIPDPPLPFTGGRLPASEEERRLVERRILLTEVAAPLAAFAALAAGVHLDLPRLAAAGVAGIGASFFVLGWFAVTERRLLFIRGGSMTPRAYRYLIYDGVAAVAYGLAFAVLGILMVLPAALFLGGASLESMRDAVLARPGQVLVPVGAALLFYGLGFLIGFSRCARSFGDRLWIEFLHAPARLGGLILIAWAAALIGVGLVEQFQHALFEQGFRAMTGNPWPFR